MADEIRFSKMEGSLSRIEVVLSRAETKLDRCLEDVEKHEVKLEEFKAISQERHSKVHAKINEVQQKYWWITGIISGVVAAWELFKEFIRK